MIFERPTFCAVCTRPRRGLTPHEATHLGRPVIHWLCVDCDDDVEAARKAGENPQHAIRRAGRIPR